MATNAPTPALFFETAFAFQRTAALKAAVDLDVFTAIGSGANTAGAIAKRCSASERGIRILCDYLTVAGFLTKAGERYDLTPDSSVFLTKASPAFLGGTLKFLASADVVRNFDTLTDTVRAGTIQPQANTVAGEEQSLWVEFARAMVPMMMPAAIAIADILQVTSAGPLRILDIAAGHGMFGITLAERNRGVEVVAVDWPGVLAVASENARKAGVQDRYHTRPGDAFKVEYGTGFDVALLTNFLHHFDVPTCTGLLRKVANALKPGGKVVILEFVPNDDRVSPPMAAEFSLTMLAGTTAGDAYTFKQLRQMAEDAGFTSAAAHALPTPETVVVAVKK
jgi:2-polyprenyl-3-methyl-5-hydroxy-6-metoxy-1,4-benzoquinol methylase